MGASLCSGGKHQVSSISFLVSDEEPTSKTSAGTVDLMTHKDMSACRQDSGSAATASTTSHL
jgi:hypothetical protein